jgi:hypothetical protein
LGSYVEYITDRLMHWAQTTPDCGSMDGVEICFLENLLALRNSNKQIQRN